jgi:hypothetical protein
LSNDPNQEYFSDGMTDALITDLAQISSVKVISRTSVMHYKKTDKTLPEIARELNVDGIVEGTVQRSGDRVRITAQLIYGPSDKHVWASSYEHIKKLRDALGDLAEQPRFIETHSRRGYRFVGSVTAANGAGRIQDGTSTGEVGVPTRSRPLYRRRGIGAVLFLAVVATLLGLDVGGVRQRWLIRASSPVIHSLAVLPLANGELVK